MSGNDNQLPECPDIPDHNFLFSKLPNVPGIITLEGILIGDFTEEKRSKDGVCFNLFPHPNEISGVAHDSYVTVFYDISIGSGVHNQLLQARERTGCIRIDGSYTPNESDKKLGDVIAHHYMVMDLF